MRSDTFGNGSCFVVALSRQTWLTNSANTIGLCWLHWRPGLCAGVYVQYCLEFSIHLLARYYRGPQWPLGAPVPRFLDPLDEIKFDLPEQDKAQFKRTCFMSDTTMAQELRRFVRWYIRNYQPGDPPQLPRDR